MNTSIKEICSNTSIIDVYEVCQYLKENCGKWFEASFLKKDNTLRKMRFSIKTDWNKLNHIETTPKGLKMVKSKVARNCATVIENADGVLQCRSLPLDRIISLSIFSNNKGV